MARYDVSEQDPGKDVGPVRITNPNARRFSIEDLPNPGPEFFQGRPITWLITFDVKKLPGDTNPVPYRVRIKQRDANQVYVIKKGNAPATLLDEEEVLQGDPSIGITPRS